MLSFYHNIIKSFKIGSMKKYLKVCKNNIDIWGVFILCLCVNFMQEHLRHGCINVGLITLLFWKVLYFWNNDSCKMTYVNFLSKFIKSFLSHSDRKMKNNKRVPKSLQTNLWTWLIFTIYIYKCQLYTWLYQHLSETCLLCKVLSFWNV